MNKTPNFPFYSTSVIVQFIDDTLHYVLQLPAIDSAMQTLIDQTRDANNAVKGSFRRELKSKYSKQIEECTQRRNRAITGISQVCVAHRNHFEPEMVQAGELIYKSIQRFGKRIVEHNRSEKTTVINRIVRIWREQPDLVQAIERLNLKPWIDELSSANHDYNQFDLLRIEELSQRPKTTTVELRKVAIARYRELIKYIDALNTLQPNNELTLLTNELKGLIRMYNIANGKREVVVV